MRAGTSRGRSGRAGQTGGNRRSDNEPPAASTASESDTAGRLWAPRGAEVELDGTGLWGCGEVEVVGKLEVADEPGPSEGEV